MQDEEDGDEAGDAGAILKNLKTKWLPWQLTLYRICVWCAQLCCIRENVIKGISHFYMCLINCLVKLVLKKCCVFLYHYKIVNICCQLVTSVFNNTM